MGNTLFTKEALREMNFKAKLIRQTEALRKSDNLKYSSLIEKHKIEHGRLYMLPIEKLVGEIEGMD